MVGLTDGVIEGVGSGVWLKDGVGVCDGVIDGVVVVVGVCVVVID